MRIRIRANFRIYLRIYLRNCVGSRQGKAHTFWYNYYQLNIPLLLSVADYGKMETKFCRNFFLCTVKVFFLNK